jgi:hypothetical protein
MKQRDNSEIAILRRVTRMYTTELMNPEGAIRLHQVPDPENRHNLYMIPTLSAITDRHIGAVRIAFVESPVISMDGAAIFWGRGDNFKLWCDTDCQMKIAKLNDTTGQYDVVLAMPNKTAAWTQTSAGTAIHLADSGFYCGTYNRWMMKFDDGYLKTYLRIGLDYGEKQRIGHSHTDTHLVGDPIMLYDKRIGFGADDQYSLSCDQNGDMVLEHKQSASADSWPLTIFKFGYV